MKVYLILQLLELVTGHYIYLKGSFKIKGRCRISTLLTKQTLGVQKKWCFLCLVKLGMAPVTGDLNSRHKGKSHAAAQGR